MPVETLGNHALAVALTVPRIAAAFLILPLLTAETVPAIVRNSLFVALALVAYPVALSAQPMTMIGAGAWPLLIVKELFLGLTMGYAFGSVFWAVGMAGELIDTQIGANFSGAIDPVQGHQTTLTGSLLSQLAAWLFMASGAFMVFLDMLLTSYTVWPVSASLPKLGPEGLAFFIGQFSYLTTAALLFAAPAMILMTLIDFVFGLMNRYAQQLNVFTLTMPIKSWVATWIMFMSLGVIVEAVLRRMFENRGLLETLRHVM